MSLLTWRPFLLHKLHVNMDGSGAICDKQSSEIYLIGLAQVVRAVRGGRLNNSILKEVRGVFHTPGC